MSNQALHMDTVVVKSDDHLVNSAVGDEMVMMDMQNGNYIGLNNVGTTIWQILSSPIKISELNKQLLKMYEISREDCEQQTFDFLLKLKQQGLLRIIN